VRRVIIGALVCLSSSVLLADISLTDRSAALRLIAADSSVLKPQATDAASRHAAAVAANQAKRDAKHLRQHSHSNGNPTALSFHPGTLATGSQALIDASGVKYFINTNITFSTTSSASAARSEASYTHAVAASTSAGGVTMSTLNDAYDGYDTLCISLNGTVANCQTGNANFRIYNKLGPATTSCPGVTNPGTNRQVVFPVMNTFADVANTQPIQIQRKVFVPDNDSFSRTLNYFTNTGATPVSITAVIANNLGSDSNTRIVSSNLGGAVTPASAVKWVTSFQNFSGTTSSDPRLGHVIGGPAGTIPVAGITFVNGSDTPFWGWTFALAPGQTRIIMTFGVVQPTKALANAKSAQLSSAALPAASVQCMSATELAQVGNFTVNQALIPAMSGWMLGLLAAMLGFIAVVRRA
jgi:hypothetical protein